MHSPGCQADYTAGRQACSLPAVFCPKTNNTRSSDSLHGQAVPALWRHVQWIPYACQTCPASDPLHDFWQRHTEYCASYYELLPSPAPLPESDFLLDDPNQHIGVLTNSHSAMHPSENNCHYIRRNSYIYEEGCFFAIKSLKKQN